MAKKTASAVQVGTQNITDAINGQNRTLENINENVQVAAQGLGQGVKLTPKIEELKSEVKKGFSQFKQLGPQYSELLQLLTTINTEGISVDTEGNVEEAPEKEVDAIKDANEDDLPDNPLQITFDHNPSIKSNLSYADVGDLAGSEDMSALVGTGFAKGATTGPWYTVVMVRPYFTRPNDNVQLLDNKVLQERIRYRRYRKRIC